MVTEWNKFDSLEEISKKTYYNWLKRKILLLLILKQLKQCIATKSRAKCRVSWKSKTVWEKWDTMKTASLIDWRNPKNSNAQKLKKAHREQTKIYKKKRETTRIPTWSNEKKCTQNKTKSCQQRRKISVEKKTFQESTWKLNWRNYQWPTRHQTWTLYEEKLDTVRKRNSKQKSNKLWQNTWWSMEGKKIWWHSSLIMQTLIINKTHGQKVAFFSSPKKATLESQKNYWGCCC